MAMNDAALIQFQNAPIVVPTARNTNGHFDAKLYKACQDFEAVFVNQMLDSMRKTVDKSGLLDGGIGEGIYEDMLYQKYSESIAKNAHLGIARLLYDQLSQKGV